MYREQFLTLYHDVFSKHDLWVTLSNVSENSCWHREANIKVHTDMVVNEYIKLSPELWTKDDLIGALACAFHDVGKPMARTEKHSEARGTYFSYPGHELFSARLTEDYILSHWGQFSMFEFNQNDVFKILYLIEHHLPFKRKDMANILLTFTVLFGSCEVYYRHLRADNYGRISDDQEARKQEVNEWIRKSEYSVRQRGTTLPEANEKKVCVILIGPSGAGKSTYSSKLEASMSDIPGSYYYHSMDQLRLKFYPITDEGTDPYTYAFYKSVEDPDFSGKVQKEFTEICKVPVNNEYRVVVVDNTNLSPKRRRMYIDTARKHGYSVVAVTFAVSLDSLLKRQGTRTDKTIPIHAVKSHYMNVQQPSLGEFDDIMVTLQLD